MEFLELPGAGTGAASPPGAGRLRPKWAEIAVRLRRKVRRCTHLPGWMSKYPSGGDAAPRWKDSRLTICQDCFARAPSGCRRAAGRLARSARVCKRSALPGGMERYPRAGDSPTRPGAYSASRSFHLRHPLKGACQRMEMTRRNFVAGAAAATATLGLAASAFADEAAEEPAADETAAE